MLGRICREVCLEFVDRLSGARRKNVEKFVDRLSGAHREFTGRMLEVHWEFAEGNRELTGGSSERCRSLPKRRLDIGDCLLSVVVSIIIRVSFTNSIKRPLGLNWG
ncbi:hypothetical protein BHE74_00055793 [Ensete ventricosum]|nr:hypothetical protein BHE74_00055793 [Ensete ventricosum]